MALSFPMVSTFYANSILNTNVHSHAQLLTLKNAAHTPNQSTFFYCHRLEAHREVELWDDGCHLREHVTQSRANKALCAEREANKSDTKNNAGPIKVATWHERFCPKEMRGQESQQKCKSRIKMGLNCV